MKLFSDEKSLRKAVFLLGVVAVGFSLLHLVTGWGLPGLEPTVSALFWAAIWRWNVVKKTHPGGIWSFMYLLIVLLNAYAGLSQVWVALK